MGRHLAARDSFANVFAGRAVDVRIQPRARLDNCLTLFDERTPVSTAEAWDIPPTVAASAERRLVPPYPPRAPESMTALQRMKLLRESAIATWGQRAYEDDLIRGRFLLRSSFILNTPDAIRHVLIDNYENYTRTAAGFRVLRPVLGQGLLIAEGRAWK